MKFDEEFEILEEGIIDKLIQKRNERKAKKEEIAERKRLAAEEEAKRKKELAELKKQKAKEAALYKYPTFNPSDENVPVKELEELINNIKGIINSSIPGVKMERVKMGHNRSVVDKGYVLHKYYAKIFTMSDDNLKKFISASSNGLLKTKDTIKKVSQVADKIGTVGSLVAGNMNIARGGMNSLKMLADISTADIDKLIEKDFVERIVEPITNLGFNYSRRNYIKDKDGLTYLNIKVGNIVDDYQIVVSVRFLTRPEDVVEGEIKEVKESMEVIEEGLFGNPYKKKSDDELEKEREKLRADILKTNKPIEVKKKYRQIRKIDDELKRRDKDSKPKKDENKKTNEKSYEGSKIKSDIDKILKEVEKMLNNESGVKEFNKNGLEICKGKDVYYACGDDHSEFIGGVDTFQLVYIDLWDYKGGNPREIMNDSSDGWHPVNHAEEKLRLKIEKFLKEKYPHFYLCDYGGDWDTGGIEIGLRR